MRQRENDELGFLKPYVVSDQTEYRSSRVVRLISTSKSASLFPPEIHRQIVIRDISWSQFDHLFDEEMPKYGWSSLHDGGFGNGEAVRGSPPYQEVFRLRSEGEFNYREYVCDLYEPLTPLQETMLRIEHIGEDPFDKAPHNTH